MMLGERTHPSIQVPPWPSSPPPDPTIHSSTSNPYSPLLPISGVDVLSPSSHSPSFASFLLNDAASLAADLFSDDAAAVDAYSCDEFRMYEFKVRRCARGRSHDWTECPYAHPGEKARRRDPRRYHYSGAACPDFRKGNCKKGDACEFAHGVFECWLHPARYRTQPCKDGVACRRRVCFFAHTPEQLRVLPAAASGPAAPASTQHSPRCGGSSSSNAAAAAAAFDSYDGSPMRHHHLTTSLEAYFSKSMLASSPTSTLTSPPISPPSDSPPLSPGSGPSPVRRAGGSTVNDLLASLRQLQLNSSPVPAAGSPWQQIVCSPPVTTVRRGPPPPVATFSSLPSTPTGSGVVLRKPPTGLYDVWDDSASPMAVVESGRDLRAKLAEKLSKENSLGRPVDVGWVSDLLD